MRNGAIRGLTRTQRVPCAEAYGGAKLEIDPGVDPNKAGWQLLFKGYGSAIVFNALPLTFLVQGKLVAQVISIRAEGKDWHGMLVPEPAPATPEEADVRFGVESQVGEVMRQVAEALAKGEPPSTLTKGAAPAGAMPVKTNRAARRRHEALVRRKPEAQARRSG